jgi:hypothetical protein
MDGWFLNIDEFWSLFTSNLLLFFFYRLSTEIVKSPGFNTAPQAVHLLLEERKISLTDFNIRIV